MKNEIFNDGHVQNLIKNQNQKNEKYFKHTQLLKFTAIIVFVHMQLIDLIKNETRAAQEQKTHNIENFQFTLPILKKSSKMLQHAIANQSINLIIAMD